MTEVIAAGQYDSERAFLFETSGRTHTIRLVGKSYNEKIFSWNGNRLSDGCYRNNIFVASTFDATNPYIYVIENDSVRKVFTGGSIITSIRFCADSTLIAVGDRGGRVYYIDLLTENVTKKKLSDLGLEKPGRKLWRVNVKNNGYIICGAKQLCLDFDGDKVNNIGDFDFTEHIFDYAIQLEQEVWVSGLFQTYGMLFKLKSGILSNYDVPTDKKYAPLITEHNSKLILAKKSVFYGLPGDWKKIHDFGEPTLIELVALPNIENELLCVGYTGKLEWITLPRAS